MMYSTMAAVATVKRDMLNCPNWVMKASEGPGVKCTARHISATQYSRACRPGVTISTTQYNRACGPGVTISTIL